mmetsp:Transcript_27305/g.88850  ORF Transcript_27305/g.88850 Transcript_27305/m.88850 type:complete len:292 (+) Transcript_27305:176-1051(+)
MAGRRPTTQSGRRRSWKRAASATAYRCTTWLCAPLGRAPLGRRSRCPPLWTLAPPWSLATGRVHDSSEVVSPLRPHISPNLPISPLRQRSAPTRGGSSPVSTSSRSAAGGAAVLPSSSRATRRALAHRRGRGAAADRAGAEALRRAGRGPAVPGRRGGLVACGRRQRRPAAQRGVNAHLHGQGGLLARGEARPPARRHARLCGPRPPSTHADGAARVALCVGGLRQAAPRHDQRRRVARARVQPVLVAGCGGDPRVDAFGARSRLCALHGRIRWSAGRVDSRGVLLRTGAV